MVVALIRYQEQRPECCGCGWHELHTPQTLTTAQDSQHGYHQQKPGSKASPATYPCIWDRPHVAYQVEIRGGISSFGHKEDAVPQAPIILFKKISFPPF